MSGLWNESPKDPQWNVPEPLAVREARMDDGTAILLRRHGNPDGDRIVLSHANGFAADAYYPFWSLLADRFDIVLYDFRNHGWNAVGPLEAHSLPTFVDDMTSVARAVERHFGRKPAVGVFHSLSGQTAMLEACTMAKDGSFAALVLFDPFICPPGCHPGHKERLGKTMRSMAAAARQRRASFKSPEDLAGRLRRAKAFKRLRPGVAELIARTTTRPAADGSTYVLRCPPEYEARVGEQGFRYAASVDVDALTCPVKVVGSDPVVPNSFLPTVSMDEIVVLNYDFVPDTTHFLQLEEPEACVSALLEFLGP